MARSKVTNEEIAKASAEELAEYARLLLPKPDATIRDDPARLILVRLCEIVANSSKG